MQLKISVRIYLPVFIWNYLSYLWFCSLKKCLLGTKHLEILSRAEIQFSKLHNSENGLAGCEDPS